MKRLLLRGATSLAIACGTAGVLAAQNTQVTGSNAPVVYTGCLRSGSSLANGSTLTPGTSTSAPLSGYVLTAAQLSPNANTPGSSPQLNPGMTAPGTTGRVPGTTPGTTSPGTTATPPAATPQSTPPPMTPPATTAPPGQSPTTTTPPSTPPTTTPPATTPSATTPPSAAGTPGAGGQVGVTPPAAATSGTASNQGTMYRVVGLQDQELQRFANQQVEIRGVMESPDRTATAGTAGAPTSSQPASPTTNPATGTSGTTAAVGTSSGSSTGQTAMMPSFRATSVRVISPNCAGGTE